MNPETRKRATMGIGGIALVLCCVAGPAVLGAIGGAATGSVLLGAGIAAAIALIGYGILRWRKGRWDGC